MRVSVFPTIRSGWVVREAVGFRPGWRAQDARQRRCEPVPPFRRGSRAATAMTCWHAAHSRFGLFGGRAASEATEQQEGQGRGDAVRLLARGILRGV